MNNSKSEKYLIYFLFFISTVIGTFLRLKNIDIILPWGDEKASLYFINHLDKVFEFESHGPIYYLLLKCWSFLFGDSLFILRFLNLILILCGSIFFLFKYFEKYKLETTFIFIAWWLLPISIIADRQIRPYGLYFDLSVLLIFSMYYQTIAKNVSELFILILEIFILLIQPLSAIIILFNLFDRSINLRTKLIRVSVIFLPAIYYYLKIIMYGKEKLILNIGWIKNDLFAFIKSLILLFGGDYYPFTKAYPLSGFGTIAFLIIIIAVFAHKNLACFKKYFFKIILTIGIVLGLKFSGINLMINRYYLFIVPLLFVQLSKIVNLAEINWIKLRLVIFTVILILYNVFIFRPWRVYQTNDSILEGIIFQIEGKK